VSTYKTAQGRTRGGRRRRGDHRPDTWAALGDPTRRAIFERLADKPCAVGELAREFPVTRPAVSQHLKVLKEAGLVVDQPAGARRIYQLDPGGLEALRAQLEAYWSKALSAYKAVIENDQRRRSDDHTGPRGVR
jgi:DNA-binding transcriptional ArsR family regulator